jgi:uncharacterized protein
MFSIFTTIADKLVFGLIGLSTTSTFADALHFFIEDTLKIFVLLIVMIYIIALFRSSLNIEKVRSYLSQKPKWMGYLLGSGFGAITPFCSCSSIPVFLGFTAAGIPVGISMAFLLTSPLINEVAVLLLLSLLGWKITIIYVLIGMAIGVLGGIFLDLIHAETLLQPFARKAYDSALGINVTHVSNEIKSFKDRHDFAKTELKSIFSRVWKWVIFGVSLGAVLHGFVPDGWIMEHLGAGQWWSVPVAVILGIPLYSNASGVIPVMESLLTKGLPLGTTLAFCMSVVAASFPEFIMLKQVLVWRLLVIIFMMLLVAFTLTGLLLNWITIFL